MFTGGRQLPTAASTISQHGISKLTIICSDYGLSPDRREAII